MSKCTIILHPDGTQTTRLPGDVVLPYDEMKSIVGGPIELVRVLREDLPGYVFTYMVCNETGYLDKLPRNQKATDLYLANVRRQFPDSPNPMQEARAAYRRQMEARGATVIDAVPDYDHSDPHVCGTVIWFKGWTCDELLEAGL